MLLCNISRTFLRNLEEDKKCDQSNETIESESSVVSYSWWHHGLWPTRLLRPWDFPGKSTGVGCHFLLQGIFPTQGSNPGLLNCRQMLLPSEPPGNPNETIRAAFFSEGNETVQGLAFPSLTLRNRNSVPLKPLYQHENVDSVLCAIISFWKFLRKTPALGNITCKQC